MLPSIEALQFAYIQLVLGFICVPNAAHELAFALNDLLSLISEACLLFSECKQSCANTQ